MNKMSFEEFKAQALENIKDYLPEEYQDAKVTLETMHKLGTSYEALIVRPEGQIVTPAVDLNLFYKDYLSSGDMDMTMEGMGKVVLTKAPSNMKDVSSWLLDYDKAKDQLFIRVSNYDRNLAMSDEVPHKLVGDLMITCHIRVNVDEGGMASTVVNDMLMEKYGIDEETLFADAIENSPKILPVKINSLLNTVSSMMNDPDLNADMIADGSVPEVMVVTNEMNINGASAMFYPGVMDELSAMMGGDFVAIPSSIHEMLVMPDQGDYKSLEHMICDVNENTVDINDQLSDHAYHYDSKDKIFERADAYEARKAEKTASKSSVRKTLADKKAIVDQKKKSAPAAAKKAEQVI